MRCKEIKKLLENQIDFPLSAEQVVFLEKHLENCVSCSRERGSLVNYKKMIQESFQNTEVPKLSTQFSADFYRRLEKENTPAQSANWREIFASLFPVPKAVSLAGAFAVLVFLMIVGIKSHLGINYRQELALGPKTNSDILIRAAVTEAGRVEQQCLADNQSKELLKNFL